MNYAIERNHIAGSLSSPQLLSSRRYFEVTNCLRDIFPLGRVQRGSVLLFAGMQNSGVTSTVFEFLSAMEIRNDWCALVGFENLGFLAASEKGVDLKKLALIPDPGKAVAQVAAVLLEAFPVVVVKNPRFISHSQARNLIARIKVHKSIMVVIWHTLHVNVGVESSPWFFLSDYVIEHSISGFYGLGEGDGFIKERIVSLSLNYKRSNWMSRNIQLSI